MMDMMVGHDGHELTSMTSMTSRNHTQKAGLDLAIIQFPAIAWVVSRMQHFLNQGAGATRKRSLLMKRWSS